MANDIITPAPVDTTVNPVEVAAAPINTNPETSPVVAASPAPAPEAPKETPVAAPEKPVETLLAEPLPTPTESVQPSPEAPKPAEEAPKEGEIQDNTNKQGGQSDEPAPPPSYEPFKIPEGIQLDTERLGTLTKLLGDLEISGKLEHTAMQEFGQKLIDTHLNEVQKSIEEVTKYYQTTWEKQKTGWKESFLKDPDIGGNRFQTTVDAARTFIKTHGGTEEQQKEFRSLMESSGLGNHPAMIRLLANAGKAMAEPKPLVANTPVPAPQSKTRTLYGNMSKSS